VVYQDITQQINATIKPNDIIAINIASVSFLPDERPNQVFLEGGLAYNEGSATGRNTYLVDSTGFIDYPRIGRMKMGGLTVPQAKEQLALRLKDYLKQPSVEIRIVNYRITMLGEIGRPGPLQTTNHKLTIVDAIASAGGIPFSGRMDNVLIIRETNGKREFGHVDLNSRNVFNSPYYYLHQNDIVYVEPSRIRRQDANEFLRLYLPAITTVISTALTVYAVVQIANSQK
jgi:polysaccharide export outer membrane protein